MTDRQVRAAVRAGARDVTEVADHCGAASRCGACVGMVRAIIDASAADAERPVWLRALAPTR